MITLFFSQENYQHTPKDDFRPRKRSATLLRTDLFDILFVEVCLANHIAAHVRHQCFRYAYAVGRLVVFEQRSHDARQRQRRAVEGVAEFGFAIRRFVTAFQAIGLVGFEVRHRTNLEPTFLCGRECFEVETECRRETHVATAKAQNAIR